MDNWFEILIYLFIIIAFLNSIFRKKKKQTTQPGKQTQFPESKSETGDLSYQSSTKEPDDFDMLKEIEKMFQMEVPAEKESGPLPDPWEVKKPAPKEKSVSWDQPTVSEHSRSVSETKFESDWEKKRQKLSKEKELVEKQFQKKASEFEELLKSRRDVENIRITNLKEKILNPDSLKEYILVSEILGKPRALS